MNNNIEEVANRILSDDRPAKIYRKLLGYIFPSKIFQVVIWTFLSLLSSLYSYLTVNLRGFKEKLSSVCDLLIAVDVSLLGIAITGYAIFQAFLSPQNTIFLLNVVNRSDESDGDKVSIFEQYNFCFYAISVMACITLLYCTICKLVTINPEIVPPCLNTELIKFVVMFFVIFLPLIVIYDMLSFIYSIYQAFTMQAALNVVDYLKENRKEKEASKSE